MNYSNILVHVPLLHGEVQLKLAAALAKSFSAHLTGLCSLRDVALLRDAKQNPFLRLEQDKVRELIKREYEQAAQAEKRFAAIAAKAGVQHSWVTGEGDPADLVIHACRLQDLAIVEQCVDPSDLLWGPAVQLALSGHPALIVPNSWGSVEFGRRVLIAWNGSAQSAAALRKARPLLKRAEHVTVALGLSRAAYPAALRLPPLDVLAYLEREGIAAESREFDFPDETAGRRDSRPCSRARHRTHRYGGFRPFAIPGVGPRRGDPLRS